MGGELLTEVLGWIRTLWAEITWAVTAVRSFPLYVAELLVLGVWVFWRGRMLLCEPQHEISIEMPGREPTPRAAISRGLAPLRTLADWARRLVSGRVRARPSRVPWAAGEVASDGFEHLAVQADPRGARGMSRAGTDLGRFAHHDAPLWMLAWAGVTLGCVALALADGWLSIDQGRPHALETLVLGRVLPTAWLPLSRPGLALGVYTLVAYLVVEVFMGLLRVVLGLRRLHLVSERHPRRRFARALFGLCGFREFRWLDYSAVAWWVPLGLILSMLLVWADLRVFCRGSAEGCGVLAVLHLFPMVFARSLDYVWLRPVRFHQEGRHGRRPVPVRSLPRLLARDGWVYGREGDGPGLNPVVWKIHEAEAGDESPCPEGAGGAARELLQALTGGSTWYAHQHEAWVTLEAGRSAVLVSPPEAGKSVWVFFQGLAAVVRRGETVLFVYPGRRACRRHYDRFTRALFATGLRWNLRVLDLSREDAGSLDWGSEAASIVFADADALEDSFLSKAGGRETFLADLGLVVLEDVERMTGATASNLFFLLRRLRVLLDRVTTRPLRFACTSEPVGEELEEQLSRLTGMEMVRIERDASPTAEVYACLVRPPSDVVSGVRPTRPQAKDSEMAQLYAVLEGYGHVPLCADLEQIALTGMPARWIGDETAVLGDAAVSVARLDDRNAFRTLLKLRNAGARSPVGVHVSFWIAKPEAQVGLLVEALERCREGGQTLWAERENLPITGAFCFATDNDELAHRHFLSAVAGTPMTDGELERVVGRSFARADMARPGSVQKVPGFSPGGGGRREPGGRMDVVCTQPVSVRGAERSGGGFLLSLDSHRVATWLYPGRVLVVEGQRYRVPLGGAPPGKGPAVVELETASLFTVKLRVCSMEWVREMSRIRTQVGPVPMVLRRGEVRWGEEVQGYREWTEDTNQHVATHHYEQFGRPPVRTTVNTRAAELCFPGMKLGPEARRGVTALMRTVVSARLGNDRFPPEVLGEDELPLVDGEFCLRIVETQSGGVGYVERLDPLLVVEWLRLARLLVEHVGTDERLLLHSPRTWWAGVVDAPSALAVASHLKGEGVVREFRPDGGLFPVGAGGQQVSSSSTGVVEEVRQFLEAVVPPGGARFSVQRGTWQEEPVSPTIPDEEGELAREIARIWELLGKRILFEESPGPVR